jgi:hypothetical protein
MAKSQSDSSRVRQDQPESIISGARIFSHNCGILLFSKANVRSNYSLDLHFLYAHLEVVRFKAMGSARPLHADAAKLCANYHNLPSRYKPSTTSFRFCFIVG